MNINTDMADNILVEHPTHWQQRCGGSTIRIESCDDSNE